MADVQNLDGLTAVIDGVPDSVLPAVQSTWHWKASIPSRQDASGTDVRQEIDIGGAMVERATVFIPQGKINYFLDRITQYLDTADEDKPRNRKLVDRIQAVRAASIEALWTDPHQEFPRAGQTVCNGGVGYSNCPNTSLGSPSRIR